MSNIRWLYQLAILFLASGIQAAEVAPRRFPVDCGQASAFIPLVSSQPIDKQDVAIERVIVAIHSSGFDAAKCYRAIQQAASRVPGAATSTLVIAPQFFDVQFIKEDIPRGLVAWKVSPYRGSSLAVVGPEKKGISFSAYAALDQLLRYVADKNRFPKLKHVVVAGHSSGGQMAQRYALVGKFAPRHGVKIRYVASAPSSFAYLTPERPNIRGRKVSFRVPSDSIVAQAPNYNKWGYGLEARYQYFNRASEDYLRKRYKNRCVLYLCGSRDTDTRSSSLSRTGGAMLQGRQRLERTQLFFQHLLSVYGEELRAHHAMAIARGVDHDGFSAYSSAEGRKFLFDFDRRDSDGRSAWQQWLNDQ